jgi:hypothetical protein
VSSPSKQIESDTPQYYDDLSQTNKLRLEYAKYLTTLMTTRNRTSHYEVLVVEQRSRPIVAPLYAALLDLFSHLILSVQLIYGDFERKHRRTFSTFGTLDLRSIEILLDKIKGLEKEAHVQANRYLQWKQTHILETMQREQAEMAAKMEQAMTTKMKLLENKMSEELRMIREALIGQKTGMVPTHTGEESDTTGEAMPVVCEQQEQQELDEGR